RAARATISSAASTAARWMARTASASAASRPLIAYAYIARFCTACQPCGASPRSGGFRVASCAGKYALYGSLPVVRHQSTAAQRAGERPAGLRNVEVERAELGRVQLIRPQQRPSGDAGIDGVAAVVAGVVPPAGAAKRAGAAAGGMKLRILEVAGIVVVLREV